MATSFFLRANVKRDRSAPLLQPALLQQVRRCSRSLSLLSSSFFLSSFFFFFCFCICYLPSAAAAAARRVEEKTPYPCKEKYEKEDIEKWVDEHLSKVSKDGHEQPHLLLMMGGSGSGKGTFMKRWHLVDAESHQTDSKDGLLLSHFAPHGLDEYLDYIPEYQKTIQDPEAVYKDAADACYPGAAIPAAKLGLDKLISRKAHVIYEETGKNLDRIRKRVLPPFLEAGYRITMVFVDNNAENAISRAAGRFQTSGRYAPDDYIRGTFSKSFDSYRALKDSGDVSESVYCDNFGTTMKCWADGLVSGPNVIPPSLLLDGKPEYRSEQTSKSEL
eukprot:CAMPEP_0206457540 /NCGR_PEP_ID=MMETSP0324_2-20121206/23024_1 /ASSEMBLY_ACC=CAM_ASM_000836 /TAXON_ID=2866 /ORGANISM="Crypthecodinium cohnii, Strain Seligo" /LENGTH=330 /DNA_ID=CAMNT_0053928685 /DNA_START=53 /DNA_END=1045 /DNA_ORIENTATION=-